MENAIDALKIAFAVFVFVIALSLSMQTLGQAKNTSETVFYLSDKTNFYDELEEGKYPRGRIVSVETIVPTLYRYYKENFNVVILDKNYNKLAVYNLEEEIKNYNLNRENAPWLGANVDTKTRIDVELDGVARTINGIKYYAPVTGGLLNYFKGKKFQETFLEQYYSGQEVTSFDNESIELVKGNSKMWIVYQEV